MKKPRYTSKVTWNIDFTKYSLKQLNDLFGTVYEVDPVFGQQLSDYITAMLEMEERYANLDDVFFDRMMDEMN